MTQPDCHALYRRMLDELGIPVFAVDADGAILAESATCALALGRDHAPRFDGLVLPEDLPVWHKALERATGDTGSVEVDLRLLRAERRKVLNRRLRLTHDRALGVVLVSILDPLPEAMRPGPDAELLNLVADTVPALISYIDRDLVYRFANRRYARWFNYPSEKMVGAHLRDVLWPDLYRAIEPRIREALEGKRVTYVGQTYTAEGLLIYQATYLPHFDHEGVVQGVFGMVMDITELKQSELLLRRNEEKLKLVFQASNDGLWDWNVLTGEVEYSSRFKEMLGFDDDEFDNTLDAFLQRLHPEDLPVTLDILNRHLRGEIPYYVLFRMRHKDGSWRWILSRGMALFNENRTPVQVIGSHTDLTTFKELQEQLHNALQKAEAANKAKTDFLANISHEVRTPMNAILGLTEILMETRPSGEQQQYLNSLKSSANSLLISLNDILDLTRIEAGRMALERHAFALPDLVDEVSDLFIHEARAKGLVMEKRLDPALARTYCGDPYRIRQVLSNLMSNAIKFTEQGSVTLAVKALPHYQGMLEQVQFTVRDTGIGIPQEKLPLIFEKFTQADTSNSRKYGGSGLGLTICRHLANLMGGGITVESAEGGGSCFYFTVPLERDEARQPRPRRHAAAEARPETAPILLVEDYGANILVATTLLRSLGYPCKVAHNGREALEMLKSEAFSLVLMDIQMPGLDGVETARAIRRNEAGPLNAAVPIIAVTALNHTSERIRCETAGMNGFVAKPFTLTELSAVLETFLEKAA